MELITEYLVIIEKKASTALYNLCNTVDDFKKLLESDSSITLKKNLIKLNSKFECLYEIKSGNIEGKEQRFFNIKFSFKGEEKDLDEYIEMFRKVRTVIYNSGGQPETLTNDVSLYFAQKSYPLIHKVENLMRKLIAHFMLTKVGKDWVIETSPTPVREAIEKSKRKQYVDVLHQIDFIQLADFLFKPYQTKDVKDLYDKLENAQNIEELDLKELKEFKAKSNWERYFSSVVECSNEFLSKKWTQLYELRCAVAHNAIINKNDYENIEKLVKDVSEHLEKAINNLDKVYVPTDEKEQLAENAVSNFSFLYGTFIQLWKVFESKLIEKTIDLDDLTIITSKTPLYYLRLLHENNEISQELIYESEALDQFRNMLLHNSAYIDEEEITHYTNRLENLIRTMGFGKLRPMVKGEWTCSDCGLKITELSFKPSSDRPILCRNCHSIKRLSRPSFSFNPQGRY